ncbi:adenylate/guanylate cyclase domain-containing protein [Flavobacterium sp.]|uniref:adenylate/guanylate cyclase domain-containing protein n=1 Tax=Flavobacterium sp. TaxID=239 RepID=UPI0024891AED|nr:adenylate/guanylate cyclase domain-containing protein [Flavobacterium sp.]MDI1316828.1 adenylate/guanylate cyclase domain-containing protein [Flavobacterium sp.]
MVKNYKVVVSTLILFSVVQIYAQKQGQSLIDSLLTELPRAKSEKQKAMLLNDLSNTYGPIDSKKAIQYGESALSLAQKNGWKDVLSRSYNLLGMNYQRIKNYDSAIEYYLKALKINEDAGNKKNMASLTANIGSLYYSKKDNSNALDYYLRAAKLNEELGNKKSLPVLYSNIGNVYNDMSNTPKALEYFVKSSDLNEAVGNQKEVASTSTNIGNIYRSQNNPKALDYYLKSLKIHESLDNVKGEALNANSIGSLYFSLNNYTNALEYYSKSQKAFEQIGNKEGASRNIGNIGITYLEMAQDAKNTADRQQLLQQAMDKLDSAIKQLTAIGSNDVSQQFSKSLSFAKSLSAGDISTKESSVKRTKKDTVYIREDRSKEYSQAQANLKSEYSRKQDSIKLESRNKELSLSKEMDLQQLKFEYEKKQAQAKTDEERLQLKQEEEAKRQRIESNYKTLINAVQTEKALAQAKQEKKNVLAQIEIKRQKNIRNATTVFAVLMLIMAFLVYRNYRNQKKSYKLITEANRIILIEKQRSEDLLLNILPIEIAEELKTSGKIKARFYNEVSVLFTDFVDFTHTSEKLKPEQLVDELHACFSAFDEIIGRNGLEKIKTIGDSYMAVCGLPDFSEDHAKKTVQAAIEIRDFINERKKNENVFEIRIGINSGQVVAGIVGVKKFAYDIWGDTVNTASRMESSGEAGKVNISQSTQELVKEDFQCTYRGKISAKNKGEIDMYFAEKKI